jgi:ribosomal protein S18 acetylase RimI-like enzyme
LHSAIDGYSRLAYTEALADERAMTAVGFLERARAWFLAHGIEHIDTQIAEVKRMWVASGVRGLGLGRRLLERLSAEAASRGMVILRLETNRSLSEAKHLYERAGFVEVEPFNNEPYAHHWFQKDLRHE